MFLSVYKGDSSINGTDATPQKNFIVIFFRELLLNKAKFIIIFLLRI